jgi:hypothetical protein
MHNNMFSLVSTITRHLFLIALWYSSSVNVNAKYVITLAQSITSMEKLDGSAIAVVAAALLRPRVLGLLRVQVQAVILIPVLLHQTRGIQTQTAPVDTQVHLVCISLVLIPHQIHPMLETLVMQIYLQIVLVAKDFRQFKWCIGRPARSD